MTRPRLLPPTGLSIDSCTKQEHAAAAAWAKESTGAYEVRRLQLTVTAQSLRTSPVYAPVYIFRSLHFGAPKVLSCV